MAVTPPTDVSSSVPDFPKKQLVSDQLTATRLSEDVYVLQWWRWEANVLVVQTPSKQILLVDSPGTAESTRTALDWVEQHFGRPPSAAFTSHFHLDGSGGNAELQRRGIPIYAADLTYQALADGGAQLIKDTAEFVADDAVVSGAVLATPIALPDRVFPAKDGLSIVVGDERVEVRHLHGAHTSDHVAVFFPRLKLVYGGCAVRHLDSLGEKSPDVDYTGWHRGMQELLAFHPRWVIPGHGSDYTQAGIVRTLRLLEATGKAPSEVSGNSESAAELRLGEASATGSEVERSTLEVDGVALSLHLPKHRTPPLPTVLVLHSAMGRTGSVLDWCDRLAQAGFAAVAFDFYRGKTAARKEEAVLLRSEANARAAASKSQLQRVFEVMETEPRLQASQRFVMGWSFGGAWATYALTFLPQVSGVIAFYGQAFTDNPVLYEQLQAPVLMIGGERDAAPSRERMESVAAQLRAHDKEVELLMLPAGHGFMEHAHPGFEAAAASQAWERALGFLRRNVASEASPREPVQASPGPGRQEDK